jgi:hypothetical protein
LQNIVVLISKAAQDDWSKVADVTAVPDFVTPSWAKELWLRAQLRDVLIDGFRNQPLLRTVSGKPITPRTAWIPLSQNGASSSELWRVTEKLKIAADLLPRSQDQQAWGQSLQSWLPFLNDKEKHPKEIWSVEKLALLLESLKTVRAVSAALQSKPTPDQGPGHSGETGMGNIILKQASESQDGHDDADAISWINEVHALIVQAGCVELFRNRALIPNENGNFVKLGTLHLDSRIDEGLKDIAEQLGYPIRAILIHPEIKSDQIDKALPSYSEGTLVNKVLDLVRTRFPEHPLPEEVRKASVSFFGWLLTRGQTLHLDNYPVLSQVESAKNVFRLQLRANSAENQKWLAPIELWPSSAKEFSDLFADSVILHPDYAKACSSPEQWKKLESNGHLHLGPFYEAESKVSDFLPDEPLPPDEEKTKPNSEVPQIRSQIPFFSGDDHFVL